MKKNVCCWSLYSVVIVVVGLSSSKSYHSFSLDNKNGDLFNVVNYGAVASSDTDNSPAFLKAWNAACNKATTSTVLIPKNMAFLVSPTIFKGPCKTRQVNFKILGTIMAPPSPQAWKGKDSKIWLVFKGVNGLIIDGLTGTVDGQGEAWWKHSCQVGHHQPGCTNIAPNALTLTSCNKSILKDVHFIRSPQTHVDILDSAEININNLRIDSSGSSPNTDGIHIESSHHVFITNTKIHTGDDCISIGDHTSNVNISHVECGPGHGISIGSLGKKGTLVQVEDIHVRDSTFIGAKNGARIKTWQAGKGQVRRVTFENLHMQAVKNPIVINQFYRNKWVANGEQDTRVHISDVVYRGMNGTSMNDIAINLNCSRAVPCSGITLTGISISSNVKGKKVSASCNNAHGQEIGVVVPGHCLTNRRSLDGAVA